MKSVSTDKRPSESKYFRDDGDGNHVDLISSAQSSDAELKKPSSCPSLVRLLPCQKCGYTNQRTVSNRCVACDLPVTVPNIRIMLYKNESPVKSDQNMGDHLVETKEQTNVTPAAAAAKSNCLKRSMSCRAIVNSTHNVESSPKNLLSEMNMWLCRTCNHSNAKTSIECIVCKSTKTDAALANDNNNNDDDDSNNNKRNSNNNNHQNNNNNGCSNGFVNVNTIPNTVSVAKQSSSNENSATKALSHRKSCSFLLAKPTKPPQRLSLSDAHEPLSSPDSPKYSYIGISEPRLSVASSTSNTSSQSDSNWTCDRCSFAENSSSDVRCSVCDALASESSLIVVAKDSVRYTPPKRKTSTQSIVSSDPLRQNLDDDFQFLPATNTTTLNSKPSEDRWVCKKCTLVNAADKAVCVVCGGSKISSLTSTPEATLKRGEFWMCPRCTLKNALKFKQCNACKTPNPEASSSIKYNTDTGRYAAEQRVKGISSRRKLVNQTTTGSNSAAGDEGLANGTSPRDRRSWICDECTFENSVESPCCEMCQSSRPICINGSAVWTDTFSKHLSDSDNTSIVLQTKQQSELMEQLRQNEEEEALIKWQQIVQYCKEVYLERSSVYFSYTSDMFEELRRVTFSKI